jgi:hypothetical protein
MPQLRTGRAQKTLERGNRLGLFRLRKPSLFDLV